MDSEKEEKIEVAGHEFTKIELEKLYFIAKDLAETNDYEWPYRGPQLQSRASAIVQRSTR